MTPTHTAPTRRGALVTAIAGCALLADPRPALAARDETLERFVQTSVDDALSALTAPSLTPQTRQETFGALMQRFADVPRLANFVLGRHGRRMQADPARWARWVAAFTDYSMAVYEDQFTLFQAGSFRVVGSQVRRPDADVIVQATILPHRQTRPQRVDWRLLRGRDGQWRVLDIRTVLDGNEIWLAERQQADFLSQLDRTGADLDALITQVERLTASLRARLATRR